MSAIQVVALTNRLRLSKINQERTKIDPFPISCKYGEWNISARFLSLIASDCKRATKNVCSNLTLNIAKANLKQFFFGFPWQLKDK